MKIEIRRGRLIDPRNDIARIASVYIDAGKVVAIGDPPKGFSAN